jgi:hypothetical protein
VPVFEGRRLLEKALAASALKPGIEDVKSGLTFAISAEALKPGQAADEHIAAEPFNRYAKDKVTISGGRGAVRMLGGGKVRFSTPEVTYMELTCGSIGIRGMGPFDGSGRPCRPSPHAPRCPNAGRPKSKWAGLRGTGFQPVVGKDSRRNGGGAHWDHRRPDRRNGLLGLTPVAETDGGGDPGLTGGSSLT